MSEKRFCPYCGNEVSIGANFCGGCGKSLTKNESKTVIELNEKVAESEVLTNEENEEKKPKQSDYKDKMTEAIGQVKEGSQRVTDNVKQSLTSEQTKTKIDQSISGLKNISDKTKKILVGIVAVVLLISGWTWFSGKDYRHEMKNGETYFNRGEYGEAQKYFKSAQDLKPGNKKALFMYDSSTNLANVWNEINNSGTFSKGAMTTYDEVESKAKSTSDKEVKQAYQKAAEAIKGTLSYELEERIGNKYRDAYDIE